VNAACERKVISLDPNVDDKEAEAQLLGAAATTAAAGETLARLLSGEVLGVVGRSVGLDALRLEQAAERRDIFDDPTLISGDVNPAARLTLAKRVGSSVELVYSQNLADDGFTWSTTYLGRYGMSGRLLILDDQSRAYEFRHEPPLGGARDRRPRQPPGPRVAAIRIVGTPGFPDDQLRRQLRLREGDRFAFGTWQQDRDRLERFYHSRNLLEARIRARRVADASPDQGVVLEYAITRGPVTNLDVRGAALPKAVLDRLSDRWATALFDGFLEKDARTIVRDYLFREGHFQANVTASVSADAAGDVKTLTIDAVPGPTVPGHVEIKGNSILSTGLLLDVVHNTDALAAWLEPDSMKRLLEAYCRSQGFLTATVSVPAPQDRNGRSVVEIVVNEGRPYSIGVIEVNGMPVDMPESREALGLSAGDRYRPASVEESAGQLELRLRNAAYRESSVEIATRVDAATAKVNVALNVAPGPRSILRDVIVEGADLRKPIVARSIVLPLEAPLDMASLVETRRRLYDLDIYRTVDVQVEPLATGAAAAPGPAEQPVAARIVVEERPRYRLRYGLAVNDEVVGPDARDQRIGLAADLENRNVLGLGASARLSVRLRSDQQVGRFTVGAKRFFGLPIRTTVFVEREREQLNPDADFPTTSSISTLTGEQAYRVRPGMEFRYGYGFERNHTFVRSNEPDPFDLTVNIARFTTSGLVDRRDDAFNPVRGWFTASTLEFSAPGLGSDLTFVKYFGQVSGFIPLDRGMVIASGIRVGLARPGEDEVLIPSERFYAGGANTVRGYREDDLGARGILGDAEGGSALLVMNGELRFPVFRRLRGVGFLDAGNVYPAIGDVSVRTLQVGAGAGARLDTPFGLIRFDVGRPVNRRPSDPRWRFHFGLGHAF
jgi:outer membrane protein assembly complex protein YaeT